MNKEEAEKLKKKIGVSLSVDIAAGRFINEKKLIRIIDSLIEELEAKQNAGIENIEIVLELCDNEGNIDPRQVESARAELAQLVPIGALRTLAIWDANREATTDTLSDAWKQRVENNIAYAIAHPTEDK